MSGFVKVIFLYLKNQTQWQKLVYAQNKNLKKSLF